jgi:hypothetical protein
VFNQNPIFLGFLVDFYWVAGFGGELSRYWKICLIDFGGKISDKARYKMIEKAPSKARLRGLQSQAIYFHKSSKKAPLKSHPKNPPEPRKEKSHYFMLHLVIT